ncbi:MAG: squalene-associated FAD-dependent desaturase [bacterium]|nr:MAG: squalene-associated FAD-dependent desaturase [bacterium]KAF0148049.1 MAG: squalene-associated FAD-dependent desaturase [bacterium]KAF0167565.1 MAG: squalene-associated FAD-dependent desaturase [bacterium]TXT17492.1 MAG: squalene-associated FAD-dependent desaturase [bacterium]
MDRLADLGDGVITPAGVNPVAIVGGGWAGLACAVELAAAGVPVQLFEAAKQLGGRARRVEWQGIDIDNGQHLMVGAYRETLGLMGRLGTHNFLERRPLELRVPGFVLRLPRLPAPLNLAAGLVLARGLSWRDKLAAARLMHDLKERAFRLAHDEAAADFLRHQQQPANLVERLWGPICVAALNTPVEIASAQVFCNVLRDSLAGDRADSDLVLNRADLGLLLPDAAAAFIAGKGGRVETGRKVEFLAREQGGFRLAGPDALAERVVVAAHPARLPDLLGRLAGAEPVLEQLDGLAWQPILTLWLHFATPPRFPFPMLGLGGGQAPWAFERNDLHAGLVAIVVSAEGPHLAKPAETLRDEYLELLAAQLGPLPPLLGWKSIVEKRATFACVPRLRRPDNATPVPGLYLAGDYTAGDYPATLEGAVRSGIKSARLILETVT